MAYNYNLVNRWHGQMSSRKECFTEERLKSCSTAVGTQIEARNMRAILNPIEAAHEAVKSTGAKRIISTIRIAERLDASRRLEDEIESITGKLSEWY